MSNENNTLKFRTLKANEIECRVGTTIKKKDSNGNEYVDAFYLLLYKNARVDQIILDETLGCFNWQDKYYQVKNTMVCSVGVNANYDNPSKEPYWLWKDNGGDDDFTTEQVKGELSDAFKRACFNWGIGRELYYSPKIYVKASADNHIKARYSVKVIEYKNGKVSNLAIINDKTKEVVFLYGKDTKVAENGENEPLQANVEPSEQPQEPRGSIEQATLSAIQILIGGYTREESRTKFYNWLDKNYGTMNPEMLTKTQGEQVLKFLKGGK